LPLEANIFLDPSRSTGRSNLSLSCSSWYSTTALSDRSRMPAHQFGHGYILSNVFVRLLIADYGHVFARVILLFALALSRHTPSSTDNRIRAMNTTALLVMDVQRGIVDRYSQDAGYRRGCVAHLRPRGWWGSARSM